MIDLAEQNVGRAFERRSVGGHIERHGRFAEKNSAVGLRIEVETVAAQRHERHAGRHFAVARVELLQERAAPVVFAAEQRIDGEDAVVGRAPEHRLGDARGVGGDVPARRIAAARQRDDRHFRRPGLRFDAVDERRQLAQLVPRGGAVRLRDAIVVARLRVGETDRKEPVSRVAVALEPPDLRLPGRGQIAVAMHEDDRNRRLLLGESRSVKPGEGERGGPLEKAASVQH